MDREVPQPAGRQYRGVWMRRWGSWVAEVRMPKSRSRIWLGSYPSAEEAARAFDAAAFCLRGRAAKFNFPDDPPNIPDAENLTSVEIKEAARRFACSRKEANQLVPSVDASTTTKQTEKTTASMPVPVCTPEPVEGSSSLGILGELLEEFPPEIYWMHGEVGLCDHDDGSSGCLSPLWNFEA